MVSYPHVLYYLTSIGNARYTFQNLYSKYCPVILLKRFIACVKHSQNSFLFHKIAHTNKGVSLRNQKLSYSRALELVRILLKCIGLDAQKYGLHSMRSGGASLSAALGVPDRLIIR